MPSFIDSLKRTFISVGIKKVSHTDINKGAYVVNKEQRRVFEIAGIDPVVVGERGTADRLFPLRVLFSDKVLHVSYYMSIREGSGRTPEYRMGRFIEWISEGDELIFATDGAEIFVYKIKAQDKNDTEDETELEERTVKAVEPVDLDVLCKMAARVKKKPSKRKSTTTTYDRNPLITAYVQRRSGYKCEMVGCDYEGFIKEDGGRFIEVHHIVPLSEDGEDSINNAAGLCPNCHRQLHYAADKKTLTTALKKKIQGKAE